MIRNVLLALFVCFIIAGIVVWALRGGPSGVSAGLSGIQGFTANPLAVIIASSTSVGFSLPGAPSSTPGGLMLPGIPAYDENAQVTTVSEAPEGAKIRFRRDIQGAQTDDPGSEYVEIEASSDLAAPMTLSGWSVKAASSGGRYAIGNVTLAPGSTVTLYTGGVPGVSNYGSYWRANLGLTYELWRNEHESIYLIDPSGATADVLSY